MSKKFFELSTAELYEYAEQVKAEWNGDDAGELEERAKKADEILLHLANANALYKKLENTYE